MGSKLSADQKQIQNLQLQISELKQNYKKTQQVITIIKIRHRKLKEEVRGENWEKENYR